MNDTAHAILVRDLVKTFGKRRALDGISLEVRKGELYCLLGPNGGGKSTLFRILATLSLPDSGTATVAGHDVVAEAPAVRARLGVVFQSPVSTGNSPFLRTSAAAVLSTACVAPPSRNASANRPLP